MLNTRALKKPSGYILTDRNNDNSDRNKELLSNDTMTNNNNILKLYNENNTQQNENENFLTNINNCLGLIIIF